MTVYKGCPYCDAVFAIGPEDNRPLKQHLRRRHINPADPGDRRGADGDRYFTPRLSPRTLAELRRRLSEASDPREGTETFAVILYGEGVPVGAIARWTGIEPSVVYQWLADADSLRLH